MKTSSKKFKNIPCFFWHESFSDEVGFEAGNVDIDVTLEFDADGNFYYKVLNIDFSRVNKTPENDEFALSVETLGLYFKDKNVSFIRDYYNAPDEYEIENIVAGCLHISKLNVDYNGNEPFLHVMYDITSIDKNDYKKSKFLKAANG